MKISAPLSKPQYGLYVECMAHQGELCYNLPILFTLDGALDGERLRHAIETAVANHPTLFTRIGLTPDGEPVQTVDDSETFTLALEDTNDINTEKATFAQPFDLCNERLFRMRLLRDSEHYYLLLDIHHIIYDGTSRQVLFADIERAYRGETLEPETLTMSEVALNEDMVRKTSAFETDKQWYAVHFDCGDCYSPLLPDREEEAPEEGFMTRPVNLDAERVEAFCRANGIYKSTLFTAAYSLLLARYNNEQEALFSTIYNGRTDKRLTHTVGMLVRTLPVYARFTTETTVLDFLRAGQEQMTGCRQHESYAYSDVVSDLGLQPATIFAWQGGLFDTELLCGKPITSQFLINNSREGSLYVKAYSLEGHFCVEAEYSANLYSNVLIRQFLESYEAVLEGLLTQQLLGDISITTDTQVDTLDSFNQTDCPYDDTQTIVSLFRRQAKATPSNIAVVCQDKRYTYAEVDEISDRIAAYIATKGLGSEDVVSVLIPRSEWMAIASLGVLKAGCAYQPLDPTYPKERLNFMMQDAGAKLLIADEELRPVVDEYQGQVLLTKDIVQCAATKSQSTDPKPESLFILLYTSGSTGVPKGCQLTHANLVAFCHWYQRYYDLKPEHRVAAYASYGFDACMMDLYPALTCGAAVHIIPEEIRLDLMALNDYFEREHITHSFMTTQVGYQFATCIENHSLLHLSTGGEKLASLTPPQGYHFYNGYGPTECTIFTTTFRVDKKLKEIPIGRPLDNMRLYVVDQQGHRQPVGAAGELWVSGPQVSRGYLNRPEKTAEVYIDNPFTAEEKYSRVYRTGDIVRYLASGDIQFVGRRDGQVKIRGFRIELKEVEAVIREYPCIKDATVQAFDDPNGGKFIAAYIVSDEQVDIEALGRFILDQKPPYMVPAVTMQIDSIPLNQNQKVNKRALPKPVPSVALPTQQAASAPLNLLEQELHDIIAGIVGNTDFGITTVLGYVGLTSISAIKLAVQVNKRYGVALDAKALVKNGTLQSIENEVLAHLLADQQTATEPADQSAHASTTYPLSYAQTGVYLDCMRKPADLIYNEPFLLRFPAGVSPAQLTDAVTKVAKAHPQLFAHFGTDDSRVVQTIDKGRPVTVPVKELTEEALTTYKQDFVKPFNLKKDLLFRLEIVQTETSTCLLADFHHLVFDGGSLDLFLQQLCSVLDGFAVAAERLTYADYIRDEQQREQGEPFQQAKAFFADVMRDCENATEIPANLQSAAEHGQQAECLHEIDFPAIEQFCHEQGITPAHLLLGALYYTASRYANTRDVYLTTVSSGRADVRISDTVGMFVNTLALHGHIGETSVIDFLRTVSSDFDQTLTHEQYPFARIAADYGFHSQINYAYQVGVTSQYSVGGQPVGMETLELTTPKFRLCILIEQRGDRHFVVAQYDDAFYSHELMEGLAESIATVARHFMASPDAPLRSVSIMSQRQRREVEAMHEEGRADIPVTFLHQGMEHYAVSQPDRLALVATDGTYTYREFNETANRIAHALIAKGVQPRDRVAMLLPRTSRVMLTMYGILKAGAAFIPCDPHYPADRIQLILDDSEARYIVTDLEHMPLVPAAKAIDVEELLAVSHAAAAPQPTTLTPDDLAYLIYTSGSTGRPKGVMLHHRGICNELTAHPVNRRNWIAKQEGHAVLGLTSLSFDGSFVEHGLALFNGLTLVLVHDDYVNDPLEVTRLMNENHVDIIFSAQSRLASFMESDTFREALGRCVIVMCGGEKFPEGLMRRLQEQVPQAHIFNCYGPTETTVESNCHELTHADRVTVGRPLLNMTECIVDQDMNELPVGVVGELLIGGVQVARGYNNLPDKTAAAFIQYHGQRFYHSGDYARWDKDGNVCILGRTDNQIKLRGQRIELGEIESVMMRVEGVTHVAVLIRKLKGADHLCAYYVASRPIPAEQLKAEISQSLTTYMVPTAYLQLQEMPVTPNGKVNTKALPEPQMLAAGEYVAPQNETERTLCDIFATVLEVERIGATDNFFVLGGTSLNVTRVIIEADKAGLHVAYGDVFTHPTPRLLASLAGGESAGSAGGSPASPEASYDYTAINTLLQRNTLNAFRQGERQPIGNVLLTGATGYLGIHILKELIDRPDVPHIYCMVRARTEEAAIHRLKTMLFFYFESPYDELFGQRLHIVLGDVTKPIKVDGRVDTVFNCAAVVKHFSAGTEIEDVNVGGAMNCVRFCVETGARLIHVSTYSTAGLSAGGFPSADTVYTEQKLFFGQQLDNQYIHSKFISERIVLESIALHGLSAKVMRVGNLAPRSTDGEFQINFQTNSAMGRVRVFKTLGCYPYEMTDQPMEFSPINEVARAIVLLSETPRECCLFHPYNNHAVHFGDVLSELKVIGNAPRQVEADIYEQALEQTKADPEKARQLQSLIAYQDMAHGQQATPIPASNGYTTQVLYRLGFRWSATSWDYVDRFLTAINGLGFFES